jgi:hypothetical protein
MSPEQCLGQRIGARSDLYSLGVLLYEMLTGRPPFTDPLASAVLVKQATALPPPLPKLRQDLPRALVIAVHTLLAKRPDDRPPNARAAQKLLEKSVARPPREMGDTQPFSSTVAALTTGRSMFFRAVTPLAMIAVLGLTFFVWGRSGQNRPATTAATADGGTVAAMTMTNAPTATLDSSFSAAPKVVVQQPLSPDAARQIVNSVSHGQIGDVHVVKTDRKQNQALIAIQDERRKGGTHLFVMEPRGGRYRVIARTPLDAHNFSGANWTTESQDIDGDGYDEVICTGTNAKGHASDRRLVLYVPRTRLAYSMRVENNWRGSKRPRATFSPNAWTREAAPYRAALEQRARAAVATF